MLSHSRNLTSVLDSLYTQGRELGLSQTESRYRRFFESSLRQARSVIQRVTKIFGNTLFRARQALQVPKPISIEDSHVKIVSKTKKRKVGLLPKLVNLDNHHGYSLLILESIGD